VAREVRILAQRCATAAHDTAEKVERSMQNGSTAATDAGLVTQKLDDILRHSSQLNQLVTEIALSSREQSERIADIDGALRHIEGAAGATSANAEESAQSSTQLEAEAKRLNLLAGQLSTLMYGNAAPQSSS
jgi:methyl-accepting chemotaxis protein